MQVLNEERQIGVTLEELRQLEPAAHEVIIVDGGSTDRCRSTSPSHGAKLTFQQLMLSNFDFSHMPERQHQTWSDTLSGTGLYSLLVLLGRPCFSLGRGGQYR